MCLEDTSYSTFIFRCSVLESGGQSIPLRLQRDLQLFQKFAINKVLMDGSEYSDISGNSWWTLVYTQRSER